MATDMLQGLRVRMLNKGKGWTLYKAETVKTFQCVRCAQQGKSATKVSKNIAMNDAGETICNGCFGWLQAN